MVASVDAVSHNDHTPMDPRTHVVRAGHGNTQCLARTVMSWMVFPTRYTV